MRLSFLIPSLTSLFFLLPSVSSPQAPPPNTEHVATMRWRMIQSEHWYHIDPVRIETILLGDQTVVPGSPFRADDNWLNSLRVTIVNTSQKIIVGGQLQVAFPDSGNVSDTDPDAPLAIQLTVGSIPSQSLGNRGWTTSNSALPIVTIAPGQRYTFTLTRSLPGVNEAIVRRHLSHYPTRCWLHLQTIYFADGSTWSPGNPSSI